MRLTPAQKALMDSLNEAPEAWTECDQHEWRTALSLLRKGMISLNVGTKATFHGWPTSPSEILDGPAPHSFDAKPQQRLKNALTTLLSMGASEAEVVAGSPPPVETNVPVEEPVDPKEALRKEFAAVQERIRDAASHQYDWRGRSAEQKIDSLADAVVDLAKLCEKVLLGEQ